MINGSRLLHSQNKEAGFTSGGFSDAASDSRWSRGDFSFGSLLVHLHLFSLQIYLCDEPEVLSRGS